ncbi:unnamed protein product, partial [Leptidea sinapis]
MELIRRSWKLQEFVAHKANVNCMAIGHKSNQVLATGGDDKKVNLWAIGRQGCLMSLSGHTTPVECVCFGHSEEIVCAGSQTGALKIWDLEAAKLLRTFTGHKGAIKCMDFHPYGDYLTTGSCDSNIKLWDTRKRGCIVTYSSHRLAVNSLQFSPDGQWIASACEDGLVKVWDVRVGKVLQEFLEHTAAVTCVKFHPHEFLLASCGTDRTVNFWDMEKFQLVSKFEKDNTSIRHMTFSDDGATLLGCGNDGMHVIGWEPARVLDTGRDTRKRLLHRPTPLDEKTTEESTSGTEADEDSGAVISNFNDYTEIFRPSRALPRTPPPASLSSEEYPVTVSPVSTSLRDLVLEEPARPPPQPSPPQRQRPDTYSRIPTPNEKKPDVYSTGTNLRTSNSEMSLAPPSLGPRSLSFTRAASRNSSTRLEGMCREPAVNNRSVDTTEDRSPEPAFVPFAIDKPVGLDLEEFVPRGVTACGVRRGVRGGGAELSEQEVLGVMMRGHDSMMAILHSVRVNKGLKSALESVIALEDTSVILDVLNVMAHKPSLWNLDVCLLMLPKINELLQSKYESYMQCGCNALRLIVRNFSSVVRANVGAPVRTLGVDIPREERYAKCAQIHRLLLDIRAFLLKRQTLQGHYA